MEDGQTVWGAARQTKHTIKNKINNSNLPLWSAESGLFISCSCGVVKVEFGGIMSGEVSHGRRSHPVTTTTKPASGYSVMLQLFTTRASLPGRNHIITYYHSQNKLLQPSLCPSEWFLVFLVKLFCVFTWVFSRERTMGDAPVITWRDVSSGERQLWKDRKENQKNPKIVKNSFSKCLMLYSSSCSIYSHRIKVVFDSIVVRGVDIVESFHCFRREWGE